MTKMRLPELIELLHNLYLIRKPLLFALSNVSSSCVRLAGFIGPIDQYGIAPCIAQGFRWS